MRGALVRKRTSIAMMFQMHRTEKESLPSVQDIYEACQTHSPVVARVERKIGDESLRSALREIIEVEREHRQVIV